ncbi:UNVERIFIED_CONTAM: hypothetical protein Scaly_0051700 [Sesamum calycinum]|uniref:Uncharacterized protein n=1 Tax=Sesamum calycinum TaxID=2727403 RepID=A0AAW2SW36_9LAMI
MRYGRLKEKFNYNCVDVDLVGRSGGILLLWRKDIEVWLQSYSVNHIDAIIKSDECPKHWRFTGFYGQLDTNRRKKTWNLLRKISHGSECSWFCVGDYNEILEQHEEKVSYLEHSGRYPTFANASVAVISLTLASKVISSLGAIEVKPLIPFELAWIGRAATPNGQTSSTRPWYVMRWSCVRITQPYGFL